MGNWFKQNLWGIITGLVVGALASAALLSASVDQMYGSPTASQAGTKKSASPIDDRFPAAKSETDLSLIAASKESCDTLNAKGAKFTFSNGDIESVIQLKDDGGNPVQAFVVHSTTGQVRSSGTYSDAPPAVCLPANLNEQVLRGNSGIATEYLIDADGTDTFMWHSHVGSASLTNVYLTVSNGEIASFDDLGAHQGEEFGAASVEYGLTQSEIARVATATGFSQ